MIWAVLTEKETVIVQSRKNGFFPLSCSVNDATARNLICYVLLIGPIFHWRRSTHRAMMPAFRRSGDYQSVRYLSQSVLEL